MFKKCDEVAFSKQMPKIIYTAEQTTAITEQKTPLVIMGLARTGKTCALVAKASLLVEQGVPANKVIFLTNSAQSLAEITRATTAETRYQKQLLADFAFRIIQAAGTKFGCSPQVTLFNQSEQLAIVAQLVHALCPAQMETETIKLIWHDLQEIKQIYGRQVPPDFKYHRLCTDISWPQLFQTYQQELKKKQGLDTEDLYFLAREICQQQPELRAQYQNLYSHVFIDQLEDLSSTQLEIVQLLFTPSSLYLAYDPNQALRLNQPPPDLTSTSFLSQYFPGYKKIELREPFQTTQTLRNCLMALASHKPAEPLAKSLPEGESVVLYLASNEAEEAHFIAKEIDFLCKNENIRPNEVGIFYRTEAQLLPLQKSLEAAGLSIRQTDTPDLITESSADQVCLMKIKESRGSSFSVVFILGCEEGLLPHYNKLFELSALNEEQNLFYLALAQARTRVYLTTAAQRHIFEKTWYNDLSRFIKLLPMRQVTCFTSECASVHTSRIFKSLVEIGGHWQSSGLPTQENSSPGADIFQIGNVVEHPQWGQGLIRKIEGLGAQTMLFIAFAHQEKKIMAKYAHLHVINGLVQNTRKD